MNTIRRDRNFIKTNKKNFNHILFVNIIMLLMITMDNYCSTFICNTIYYIIFEISIIVFDITIKYIILNSKFNTHQHRFNQYNK